MMKRALLALSGCLMLALASPATSQAPYALPRVLGIVRSHLSEQSLGRPIFLVLTSVGNDGESATTTSRQLLGAQTAVVKNPETKLSCVGQRGTKTYRGCQVEGNGTIVRISTVSESTDSLIVKVTTDSRRQTTGGYWLAAGSSYEIHFPKRGGVLGEPVVVRSNRIL